MDEYLFDYRAKPLSVYRQQSLLVHSVYVHKLRCTLNVPLYNHLPFALCLDRRIASRRVLVALTFAPSYLTDVVMGLIIIWTRPLMRASQCKLGGGAQRQEVLRNGTFELF